MKSTETKTPVTVTLPIPTQSAWAPERSLGILLFVEVKDINKTSLGHKQMCPLIIFGSGVFVCVVASVSELPHETPTHLTMLSNQPIWLCP